MNQDKLNLILNLFRINRLGIGVYEVQSEDQSVHIICSDFSCDNCGQKDLCNKVYREETLLGHITEPEIQELYELYPEIKLIS